MSKISEHFREDEILDDDYLFQKWMEEGQEKEYEAWLEQEAEKASFENVFQLTGTYPF